MVGKKRKVKGNKSKLVKAKAGKKAACRSDKNSTQEKAGNKYEEDNKGKERK